MVYQNAINESDQCGIGDSLGYHHAGWGCESCEEL